MNRSTSTGTPRALKDRSQEKALQGAADPKLKEGGQCFQENGRHKRRNKAYSNKMRYGNHSTNSSQGLLLGSGLTHEARAHQQHLKNQKIEFASNQDSSSYSITVPSTATDSIEWPSLSTKERSPAINIKGNVKDDAKRSKEIQRSPKSKFIINKANSASINLITQTPKSFFKKENNRTSMSMPINADISTSQPKMSNVKDSKDVKVTDERNAALFFFKQGDKRKKKHLSTLKKKVLQERLHQYRSSLQNDNQSNDNHCDDYVVICVDNYLFSQDDLYDEDLDMTVLEEDDEYTEIIDNVTAMAKKMVPDENISVYIARTRGTFGFGSVFVEFTNKFNALEVCKQWDNSIIQGLSIKATLKSKKIINFIGKERIESRDYGTSGCLLILLQNIINTDDLNDKECLQETLSDVQKLASKYGNVKHLTVDVSKCGIYVEYDGSFSVAEVAVESLDGKLLGGERVSAEIVRNIVKLENVLTDDDLEDDECMEETLSDIKDLANKLGNVSDVKVNVKSKIVYIEYIGGFSEATNAAKSLDGKVLGGQQLLVTTCVTSDHQHVGDAYSSHMDVIHSPTPLMSGDKVIPEVYAECKRVPKMPNMGTKRPYVIPVLPEKEDDAKNLLTELLGTLMRLQERNKDDPNARSRRRIVMGLREVARGIRAGKVKMVILAYNIDEYKALDQKLQEIFDLSKEAELPVFCNFNKRKLGKAVGKSIKVSVVGVQNADGGQDIFKKLKKIHSS